jgi:coenzyme F420-0:L-glutamate ligase/coenzyme F420-1:gamma-L-glutamate ligase
VTLVLTPLSSIPIIRPGDNLAEIILDSCRKTSIQLTDHDILVLTFIPSQHAIELSTRADKDPRLVEIILGESREVLRVRPGTIIVEHRLGFVCASAGIDHSNVQDQGDNPEDWVLLLPEDPDASATRIRQRLEAASGKRIGVLIVDSHGRAWRLGVVGAAIGFSGLPGLVDLRGQPDLFGYNLRITLVAAADELAAAASLVMGQAAEGTPVVHVRGFPYPLGEGSLPELLRPKEQDMFR